MVRPLSQTGFHRIPASPLQRNFEEGGVKPQRTALDALNDKQEDRWLHPTKGWREINPKRTRAQMVLANLHAGRRFGTRQIASFITGEANVSAA